MKHPETDLQKAIIQFIRAQYPKVKVIASMSGQKRTMFEQVQAKALGMEKGVPDLFVAQPRVLHYFDNPDNPVIYHGLFLEIKAGKTGKVSKEQVEYMAELINVGYLCHVVRDLDQAMKIINEHLS